MRKELLLSRERKYKSAKVKSCLRLPLTINCLFLSMYITSVIKLVKNLTHWIDYLVSVSLEKGRIIIKAFVHLQLGYCPLIWMFHNITLNNKINRIHERALRIVYRNKTSNFTELTVGPSP